VAKKRKTTQRGRDSGTGRFISIKEARRRKKTATVDTIRLSARRRKKK